MSEFRVIQEPPAGGSSPLVGYWAPIASACLLASLNLGCGDQQREESLPPLQVGMTKAVAPIYDDGELRIYEVKKGLAFPILAPDGNTRQALGEVAVEPYGRKPWITTDDIAVQLTWTISNLDDEEHVVELLVDPWNEFGRYFPGLQLTDADNEEFMPNFSGIDQRYIVAGKNSGPESRVHGTYTYSDLEEVAIDLATVMGLIEDPPAVAGDSEEEDRTVTYANHAFHWQNRSYRDPLITRWVPDTVAGLTGLDIGFRTEEPATVAIEVVVEIVDQNGERVREENDDSPLLPATDEIITVGVAP